MIFLRKERIAIFLMYPTLTAFWTVFCRIMYFSCSSIIMGDFNIDMLSGLNPGVDNIKDNVFISAESNHQFSQLLAILFPCLI